MARILGIMAALMLGLTLGKAVWRRVPALRTRKTGLKWLVAVHPYAAGATVTLGIIHWIRAYGFNFLLTGHALLLLVVVNTLLGGALNLKIRPGTLRLHRLGSYLALGFLLIHNLFKYLG